MITSIAGLIGVVGDLVNINVVVWIFVSSTHALLKIKSVVLFYLLCWSVFKWKYHVDPYFFLEHLYSSDFPCNNNKKKASYENHWICMSQFASVNTWHRCWAFVTLKPNRLQYLCRLTKQLIVHVHTVGTCIQKQTKITWS